MWLTASLLVWRVPGSWPRTALAHLPIIIPQQICHCALPTSTIHPLGRISIEPVKYVACAQFQVCTRIGQQPAVLLTIHSFRKQHGHRRQEVWQSTERWLCHQAMQYSVCMSTTQDMNMRGAGVMKH